jgi:hypothetical protein
MSFVFSVDQENPSMRILENVFQPQNPLDCCRGSIAVRQDRYDLS